MHLHMTNPWSILVAAVLQWLIGAAWYSPMLFSKIWMAELGITPDPSKRKNIVFGMITSLVGSLVLSFVLWHVISWSHSDTWGMGALVGLIMWAGFIAAPSAAQNIYEGRSLNLFAINTGYWLICLLVSGVLIAVWQ